MKCCTAMVALAGLLAGPLTLWAQTTATAAAEKPAAVKEESKFLRLVRNDDEEPVAMQTSIISYRQAGREGAVVDLIGAVHVADKAYFTQLNKEFRDYDALLYELVAPAENNVPRDGKSQHPVGQMQQGLKSMLELSFQLEEIDYGRKNFVHADMSPAEFAKVMTDRGESFLSMFGRMLGSALALQGGKQRTSDAEILMAMFAKDRPLRLKRIMSTQFQDLESTMSAIEGPQGSTLIGQRNRKALDVLERELAKGRKKIGIFYGAGHMPDMEKRLANRFQLQPDEQSVRWLTAWDMSGKK